MHLCPPGFVQRLYEGAGPDGLCWCGVGSECDRNRAPPATTDNSSAAMNTCMQSILDLVLAVRRVALAHVGSASARREVSSPSLVVSPPPIWFTVEILRMHSTKRNRSIALVCLALSSDGSVHGHMATR